MGKTRSLGKVCQGCDKSFKDKYALDRHQAATGKRACPGLAAAALPVPLPPRRPPTAPLPPPVLLKPRPPGLELKKLLRQCSPFPLYVMASELHCPVPGIFPFLFGWRRNDPAGQRVRELSCTTNPSQAILAVLRDAARWGVNSINIPINLAFGQDGDIEEINISKHLMPPSDVCGLSVTKDKKNITFTLDRVDLFVFSAEHNNNALASAVPAAKRRRLDVPDLGLAELAGPAHPAPVRPAVRVGGPAAPQPPGQLGGPPVPPPPPRQPPAGGDELALRLGW